MKQSYFLVIALLAISLGFISCSDDEIFSKEVKVYVNTQLAPVNNYNADILVSTTNIILGESNFEYKFPVRITREISDDVKVDFAVDKSYVELFNTENKKECIALTDANCKISNATDLTIKAGDLASKDSVKIELSNLGDLKPGNYVLPIAISKVSSNDKGVQASSNLQTVFVEVTVQTTNIDKDNEDLAGTPVDRTNWIVSNPSNAEGITKIIDNDNTSKYYKGGGSLEFTVNMNETKTIKGFIITPWDYYGNYAYNATKVHVYSSEDGESWTDHSFGLNEKPVSKEDVIRLKFYTPVKAQYFKFILEGGDYGYNGLSEVNAVE